MSENAIKEKFRTKIGGQAVIEGVMMRGPSKAAMACRLPGGDIDVEEWSVRSKNSLILKLRKIPFIRGIFNFLISLIDGYKCLSRSADKQMTEDDDEELSGFERWLTDKLGDKMMTLITAVSMIVGVAAALLLFMWLPSAILKGLSLVFTGMPAVLKNIIEGLLKIAIFVGYTWLTSKMPEISKTYEYHGAEHKTIACYESGEELTPENVKKHCRFHPRCGTSFIFLVLFISIFVNTVFQLTWDRIWLRVLCKVALLPIVTGIAYELIMIAGRHDNPVTRIISAPGLLIQRITTSEPDIPEIECAVAAMKCVIPEDGESDRW